MASIQKRTSPIKFAYLAEKSENGSISNLSTKAASGQDPAESKLEIAVMEPANRPASLEGQIEDPAPAAGGWVAVGNDGTVKDTIE